MDKKSKIASFVVWPVMAFVVFNIAKELWKMGHDIIISIDKFRGLEVGIPNFQNNNQII